MIDADRSDKQRDALRNLDFAGDGPSSATQASHHREGLDRWVRAVGRRQVDSFRRVAVTSALRPRAIPGTWTQNPIDDDPSDQQTRLLQASGELQRRPDGPLQSASDAVDLAMVPILAQPPKAARRFLADIAHDGSTPAAMHHAVALERRFGEAPDEATMKLLCAYWLIQVLHQGRPTVEARQLWNAIGPMLDVVDEDVRWASDLLRTYRANEPTYPGKAPAKPTAARAGPVLSAIQAGDKRPVDELVGSSGAVPPGGMTQDGWSSSFLRAAADRIETLRGDVSLLST